MESVFELPSTKTKTGSKRLLHGSKSHHAPQGLRDKPCSRLHASDKETSRIAVCEINNKYVRTRDEPFHTTSHPVLCSWENEHPSPGQCARQKQCVFFFITCILCYRIKRRFFPETFWQWIKNQCWHKNVQPASENHSSFFCFEWTVKIQSFHGDHFSPSPAPSGLLNQWAGM